MVAVTGYGNCNTCGPLSPEGRRSLEQVVQRHHNMGHATQLWYIPRPEDASEAADTPRSD